MSMSININHTEFYSKFHFGPLSPNYDNLFGPSYLPYLSVVFVLFWVTLLVGGIYYSFSWQQIVDVICENGAFAELQVTIWY